MKQTCCTVHLLSEVSRLLTLKLFNSLVSFILTSIFLFDRKQQGIFAKLVDCQDSSNNKKWSFWKLVALFSVSHIRNTACPLLSRSGARITESFSTCFLKSPSKCWDLKAKRKTKIEEISAGSSNQTQLGH